MANKTEIRVPDIGDFDKVPVIEVLVAEGDTIEEEQSLVTLESDKATMEVPASKGGKIVELKVKEGDEVSEGDVLAVVEVEGESGARPAVRESGKIRSRKTKKIGSRKSDSEVEVGRLEDCGGSDDEPSDRHPGE